MIRILHVIDALDTPGVAKQLFLLARQLPPKQFETYICTLRNTKTAPELSNHLEFPVTNLNQRWANDPLALWQLYRTMIRLQPDLVHAWTGQAASYARAVGGVTSIPVIAALESSIKGTGLFSSQFAERWLARSTDRFVANTHRAAEAARQRGIPETKVRLIAPGISAESTQSTPRDELLKEHQLSPQSRLVGTVEPLGAKQRLRDLIRAADLVHLIRAEAALLVFGQGPQLVPLQRFVRLLEAEGHVRLLDSPTDWERWRPHLEVAWLGNEEDGFPYGLVEAMATALPVVATNIPGVRELVQPAETGFLYPVGNRAEITRLTELFFTNTELAQKCGHAAQSQVAKHYPVSEMVAGYKNLYLELAS